MYLFSSPGKRKGQRIKKIERGDVMAEFLSLQQVLAGLDLSFLTELSVPFQERRKHVKKVIVDFIFLSLAVALCYIELP